MGLQAGSHGRSPRPSLLRRQVAGEASCCHASPAQRSLREARCSHYHSPLLTIAAPSLRAKVLASSVLTLREARLLTTVLAWLCSLPPRPIDSLEGTGKICVP